MDKVNISRIAVFCASALGHNNDYSVVASELGKTLSDLKMELIYGGSSTGLMGAVANSVINNGGDAIGILPNFLQRQEVAHLNLTKLEFTNGMHERKARMNALADAFVILPGGLGTLDELFEMLTWKQLGLHAKPIVLLNSGGFFNDLIKFLEAIGLKGFLKTEINDLFYTCKSVKECITFLQKKLTINNCDQLIDK